VLPVTDPYAPPKTDALPPTPDELSVHVPGVSRKVTVRGAGLWSGARIHVDGSPAEKAGLFGKVKIPDDDGGVIEARAQYALTGLVVTVGKEKFPVGPQNPGWMGILIFAPIGLVGVGGMLGGLLGASGMLVNRRIAASTQSNGVKTTQMIGVIVLCTVLMLALAGAVRLMVHG
jgi:hypothetical protein